MTGFARTAGSSGPYRWTIELKNVNAKGLDLRLRIAPGFERVEIEARSQLAGALARGTCFAALSVQRDSAMPHVRINTPALTALAIAAAAAARNANLAAPTIDGLLAVRGIVEVIDADDDEATLADACAGALASFGEAVEALVAARRGEGAALSLVLAKRLEAIDALTRAADINPGRRPEAVRARLS